MSNPNIEEMVNAALLRVIDSPPEQTVAMVVAFMVAVDLIGPEHTDEVTIAEVFPLFRTLFEHLAFEKEGV